MTFRDTACHAFDDADDGIAVAVEPCRPVAAEPVAFSALERQVIELARGDRLASLEAPGRIERLVALLFGLRAPTRALADRRLEALRRAVVVTRHRHHMPDAVAADLARVGFRPAELRALEALAVQG